MEILSSDHTVITASNAKAEFELASTQTPVQPQFDGRGIIITAGGPFVPSAYVVVRLLRHYASDLPIEVWHAGHDEIPEWGREAFKRSGATLHDVMDYCPDRPLSEMRGWPIKPAAVLHSKLREVLFLDADCFPLRSPDFLFDSPEFKDQRALFWPDSKVHKLGPDGKIWDLTGLPYRGDTECETGIFLIDKQTCWKELCLAQWLNRHSYFWYEYVIGDKDTFYLAWRKLGRTFHLAPPCKRYNAVVTRHFWTDAKPIADHRTGTSKYSLPRKKGPLTLHLAPYKWRGGTKNIYDELMQRFFVKEFRLHTMLLDELLNYKLKAERGA